MSEVSGKSKKCEFCGEKRTTHRVRVMKMVDGDYVKGDVAVCCIDCDSKMEEV